MRAKEFIPEGDMHSWHKDCIRGVHALTGINQFYELYRFGLAMASAGREHPIHGDPFGPTEDNPTTVSYTDADDKIIKDAIKFVGGSAKRLTSDQSLEPTDTNTKSIVGTRKPLPRRT